MGVNGQVYYYAISMRNDKFERLPRWLTAYLENRTGRRLAATPGAMTTRFSSSAETFHAHIHRLLDEYISVHLTTYYVDCTQRRVYQVRIARVMESETDCLLICPGAYWWSPTGLLAGTPFSSSPFGSIG